MPFLSIIILALVQGITEFLPISSSGHLVLTHHLLTGNSADLCWEQNRMMDIAVHLGTLFSVLVFYRRDVFTMFNGVFRLQSGGLTLIGFIVLASIPAVVAGFALHLIRPSFVCMLTVMAWTTLLFGIVLWIADRIGPTHKTVEDMTWRDSLLIGLAQMLALVPGTSRSGITMSAARFLGYSRTESARFSILLALVAISGAATLTGLDVLESGDLDIGMEFLLAAFLSFLTGWGAIALMVKWLERQSFGIFALYRILMGGGLLIALYAGVL